MSHVLRGIPHVEYLNARSGVDDYFIDRALTLAWQGAGFTLSNPMVGAVVVKNGEIIGEGFHAAYGHDHAETVALDRAGEAAAGATLFVTLEPCTHQGKTPPCTDRVIQSGVSRVVVCTLDPDPRMDGHGIELLRARGIRVDVGHRVEQAILLNLPYFKRHAGFGGTLTLKMAMTLDGRIASRPGNRSAITGDGAREFVHRLRASRAGVLIGINTLLVDKPRLDTRVLDGAASPVPIVLDTCLRFPSDYRWLAEERRPVIVTGPDPDAARVRALEDLGVTILVCGESRDRVPVARAIAALAGRGIDSVLVEGGAEVFTSFLEDGSWDDLHVFVSPAVFGSEGVAMFGRSRELPQIDAVLAGASRADGDVLISYISSKTLSALRTRVL